MQNGRTALVYHDASTDPTTHPYADKGTATDPTDLGDPADSSDPADDSDPDMVEITKESRLNIPQSLLRKVGLNANVTAYLFYNDTDNKVFLVAYKPATNDITEYVVSKTGELRVSQAHLVKKFGTSSQFYKVTTDAANSTIEIEPVVQS
jgi:bifunctional DNA-binding transcriptional regulator/antitoxin component of YhaV-PrlF toxin-antitoxin module